MGGAAAADWRAALGLPPRKEQLAGGGEVSAVLGPVSPPGIDRALLWSQRYGAAQRQRVGIEGQLGRASCRQTKKLIVGVAVTVYSFNGL